MPADKNVRSVLSRDGLSCVRSARSEIDILERLQTSSGRSWRGVRTQRTRHAAKGATGDGGFRPRRDDVHLGVRWVSSAMCFRRSGSTRARAH